MNISLTKITTSLLLFFLAGLCEIGGGYLVWLWLRNDMSWVFGAVGGFVLFLYGIVPTFQKSHFHRIYAAYGGVFIIMSIFWGWLIDGVKPDNYDIIGTIIAVIGVSFRDRLNEIFREFLEDGKTIIVFSPTAITDFQIMVMKDEPTENDLIQWNSSDRITLTHDGRNGKGKLN